MSDKDKNAGKIPLYGTTPIEDPLLAEAREKGFPSTVEYKTICPWCGHVHELASEIGSQKPVVPKRGDITLCIKCGRWCVFETRAKGGLRKPNDTERELLRTKTLYRRVHRAWIKVTRDMKAKEKAAKGPTLG